MIRERERCTKLSKSNGKRCAKNYQREMFKRMIKEKKRFKRMIKERERSSKLYQRERDTVDVHNNDQSELEIDSK